MQFLVTFVALFCFVSACAHVPSGPMGDPAIDCAKGVSAEVIPAVESALVSGNYTAELVPLVAKFGLCVIQAAVQYVIDAAQKDVTAAPADGLAAAKIAHGKAWLAANPPQ